MCTGRGKGRVCLPRHPTSRLAVAKVDPTPAVRTAVSSSYQPPPVVQPHPASHGSASGSQQHPAVALRNTTSGHGRPQGGAMDEKQVSGPAAPFLPRVGALQSEALPCQRQCAPRRPSAWHWWAPQPSPNRQYPTNIDYWRKWLTAIPESNRSTFVCLCGNGLQSQSPRCPGSFSVAPK